MVGLLGGKSVRHMRRVSPGKQPCSLEAELPIDARLITTASRAGRQHFAAASALFKAIFKEALFEDSTDMKNFFNHMAFSVQIFSLQEPISWDDHYNTVFTYSVTYRGQHQWLLGKKSRKRPFYSPKAFEVFGELIPAIKIELD